MFTYTNDYANKANQYAKDEINGSLVLAYNEFSNLFKKYLKEGNRALDFGCGAGRSTRYLLNAGLSAHGVDIDPAMLEEAKSLDQNGFYQLIKENKIPQRDSFYDLIFSSLVLLEISTLNQMQLAFEEIYRTMKFNGTFIVLTVNDDFYYHDWVSVDTSDNQNKNLKSGDKVKVKIKEIELELYDYYWSKKDYRKVAEKTGFTIIEELLPLAKDNTQAWLSETNHPPYVIFVMKKSISQVSTCEKASSLNLDLLPGKGYFKENSRSNEMINFFGKTRHKESYGFLLMQNKDKFPFHKMESQETLIHVEGKDIILHLLYPDGKYDKKFLGKENDSAVNAFTVPAGVWFAEEMDGIDGYSLIRVHNKPGFHPEDCQEGNIDQLMKINSDNKELISVINRLSTIDNLFKRQF